MKRALLVLLAISLLSGCYAQAPQPVVIQIPARTRVDEQGNTITEPPNVTVIMPTPVPLPTVVVVPYAVVPQPVFLFPRPFIRPFFWGGPFWGGPFWP